MSMTEHVTCKLCGRELANKYNLLKHVRCVHRRTDLNSEDADVEELKCPYGECSFSSMYSQELDASDGQGGQKKNRQCWK